MDDCRIHIAVIVIVLPSLQPTKLETSRVPEETPEELALVISPEPQQRSSSLADQLLRKHNVTLVRVGADEEAPPHVEGATTIAIGGNVADNIRSSKAKGSKEPDVHLV